MLFTLILIIPLMATIFNRQNLDSSRHTGRGPRVDDRESSTLLEYCDG